MGAIKTTMWLLWGRDTQGAFVRVAAHDLQHGNWNIGRLAEFLPLAVDTLLGFQLRKDNSNAKETRWIRVAIPLERARTFLRRSLERRGLREKANQDAAEVMRVDAPTND
mgnify:CR=1 FL=1